MTSNWRVYAKKADCKANEEKFGIDQVKVRLIRNRGLGSDEQIDMYLNGGIEDIHSPQFRH